MNGFSRSDPSLTARWWWTVDRWSLLALGMLVGFGAVLSMAATPPVAERLGLDPFYFVQRQLGLVPVAIAIMLFVSMLEPTQIRRLALLGFVASLALVAATYVIGAEIKGARRWISIAGFSLQPSEFVKPTFAIVAAWLFATARRQRGFPGDWLAIGLYLLVIGLLVLQPDIGMAAMVSAVWFSQYFLAGLQIFWVLSLAAAGAACLIAAYYLFPHVQIRFDRYLFGAGDNYQVETSIGAFMNGGLFGRGPGEGTLKSVLPDAHSDFVFAVAGEELGLIGCLAIVGLFVFVVVRGLIRSLQETSLFVLLAVAGLLVQFGLQALINMGSTLHLMPTKGMTLPFISYGGSSLLALSIAMGMVLALTRKRFGAGIMQ